MFRVKFIVFIAFPIGFLFNSAPSFSQSGKVGEESQEDAVKSFEEGKYSEAYDYFSTRLKKYPKDGLLNYYAGLSLYFQNRDFEKAIEHLDYAAGKSNVPPDAFYYLGMAYRKAYNFPESRKAFGKFNTMAGRAAQKELIPSREAEMSGNAMTATLQYNPFEVQATSLFNFSDSTMISQVRGKGGTLSKKPQELILKNEDNSDLSSLMFLPREITKGEYVYYSAPGKSRKGGLDLYRIRKNGGKKWGEPEDIEDLNSEFDEILPYFDPVSKDLYFASKGHSSMGGFDVFKSHYDSDRDSWSTPVSLGFPVNSPMDEFIAMPGYDLGTILVITNRQGLDKSLTVYKLKLSEPKRSLATASREEMRRIGNLGGIEAIPAILDLRKENIQAKESPAKKTEQKSTGIEKPEITDPYKMSVRDALGYQAKADSLTRLAKATRVRVSTLPDPNDRWTYQRQIIEWEKMAKDYQQLADEAYAGLEQKKPEETNETIPDAIEKLKTVNDITVYQFKEPEAEIESEKEPSQKANPEKLAREAFKPGDEPGGTVSPPENNGNAVNRFVILDSSPYNANNPFPLNVKLPEGAFYRIQLGVFSQNVEYSSFGGISPITSESIEGKNLTRYYAGKFNHYRDAVISLEKVKQQGYTDAYIVGWYNGEKMALNRILEFEARDEGK